MAFLYIFRTKYILSSSSVGKLWLRRAFSYGSLLTSYVARVRLGCKGLVVRGLVVKVLFVRDLVMKTWFEHSRQVKLSHHIISQLAEGPGRRLRINSIRLPTAEYNGPGLLSSEWDRAMIHRVNGSEHVHNSTSLLPAEKPQLGYHLSSIAAAIHRWNSPQITIPRAEKGPWYIGGHRNKSALRQVRCLGVCTKALFFW